MRISALSLAFLALCFGCSSPSTDAERELEIVKNAHGSAADICAARRKVADAYLKEQNSIEYEEAKVAAAISCP